MGLPTGIFGWAIVAFGMLAFAGLVALMVTSSYRDASRRSKQEHSNSEETRS